VTLPHHRYSPVAAGHDLVAIPATARQLDAVRRRCKQMVTRRAFISAGAVLVPVPGADIAADVALLTELIPAINYEFGLTPEQIGRLAPKKKVIVYRAIVAFGGMMVGRVVTRELILKALATVGMRVTTKTAARFVPIAGQALSAGISFGAMKLVGEAHIRDCERVARSLMEASEQPEVPAPPPPSATRRLRSAAARAVSRLRRTPPA
jgi:hypothetical protein